MDNFPVFLLGQTRQNAITATNFQVECRNCYHLQETSHNNKIVKNDRLITKDNCSV